VTGEQPLTHERAFELLPWLVNGTLRSSERDAVEHHVRTCIACRRELKEQQRLQAALRGQPTVHVSARNGLERLDSRLDTLPPGDRLWAERYRNLRPFAVAAGLGVALLGFLLWLTPPPQLGAATYTTLATSPSAGNALLDVVFAEQTTAAEMRELLAQVDGEIVAGPTDVGRYTVRITHDPLTADQLMRIVEILARDSRVRFAGRSLTEPSQ
jgi:anti-sigma factor RsiW